ncbi:MAG: hypothetical protein ACXIVQ_12925 [Acidimicrobiales bacterium]
MNNSPSPTVHDATSADGVLAELANLKRHARLDSRTTSVPLLTFGALTLGAAAIGRGAALQAPGSFYWLLAGPIGCAAVAQILRRKEVARGVGTPSRGYAVTGVVLAIAAVVFLPFALLGAAMALVGVGLLALAIAQRDPVLGVCAGLYTAVAVLEPFSVLSNRLDAIGLDAGSRIPVAAVAVVLVAAGLVSLRRESTVA